MKPDPFWSNLFSFGRETSKPLFEVVTQTPIFKDLNQREFRHIEAILYRRRLKVDETLFRQGERGLGMYLILSGKVQIVQQGEDSAPQALAILGPGDFFGEQALLDITPRTASVKVLEAGEVIGFFRPDFLNLIERTPRLGLKIVMHLSQMISVRLRYTNQLLKEAKLSTRTAKLERTRLEEELADRQQLAEGDLETVPESRRRAAGEISE